MSKSILEGAMEDAKLLKETAMENAKNVLLEAFSDKLKDFVDVQLNENVISEMPDSLRDLNIDPEELEKLLVLLKQARGEGDLGGDMGGPEMGDEMGGHDDGGGDLGDMFSGDDEQEESLRDGMYEASDNDEDEKEEEDEMKEGQEDMVEVTKEDLEQAFLEVVRSEAVVTPGFGDAQNPNKNATGGLGEKSAPGERGLEDKEKEEMWKDEVPPASEDWTVAEQSYRNKLEQLSKQLRSVTAENKELREACDFLKRNLQEVNLFNTKLIYTNKLVHAAPGLSKVQREGIVERIDEAQSLREVELIYSTLSESLKIAGVLGEAKKPSSKTPKNSRYTTSSSTLLKEEAQKESDFSTNMQRLAGLLG